MAEPDNLAHVKVFRFNPKVDKEPWYETYQVPYQNKTVLDVLQYILENCDPTISFRYGCAGAGYQRCGACALLVNGKAALSCNKLAEEHMIIEPHSKFAVIKDLAIDFDRESQVKEGERAVEITVDADKCTGCRDCMLICPTNVYEVRKIDGRTRAIPVDARSCCGLTCRQCVIFCRNSAINIVEKTIRLGGGK